MVYAIAATSLNLVLGYGGMVSFGHAAFVGLGAYVTGDHDQRGRAERLARTSLATVAVTALAALVIGAISLRTRGVYFIMITLAFAQMLFYLANSVKAYGGDEGLNIRARSLFALGAACSTSRTRSRSTTSRSPSWRSTLVALARFVPSRFGRAVLALRDDDVRAEAIGFPTYRYKLVVFVVAGALGGIAGALSVNLQGYVSPNVLHWTQSGTLMVMVILGGVGDASGAASLGAAALLLLEEVLSADTEHWRVLDRLGAARRRAVRAPAGSSACWRGAARRRGRAEARRRRRRCSTCAASSKRFGGAGRDRPRRPAGRAPARSMR